jgi:hypothetical protein
MHDRRQHGRMTDERYLMYLHYTDQPIPRELMARVFEETKA